MACQARSVRTQVTLGAAVMALLLAGLPGGDHAAAQPVDPREAARQEPPGEARTVTLVTGDQVRVTSGPDGELTRVAVVPSQRPDGTTPAFRTWQDGAHAYVLPTDAGAVVPGVLDPELFNVTRLAESVTDGSLRLIVRPAEPEAGDALEATEGVEVERVLASIDAAAVRLTPQGASSLWAAATARPGALGGPLAGVERVWLDGRVEATLATSVPQIGAPAAWEAGLEGQGTTVAVLDTGIDDSHPDLAGRVVAAENFATGATDAVDRDGHGTHVASTVAGSGAASGGARRGVAPEAALMNGKVLDDFGSGYESDVIAGMEWAAEGGADVVNMSLGGGPTDGTDSMSQALDALTEAHDTLFVVAAGNEGEFGEQTIGTPASADRALAVGAVDADDELAWFSSTGPRVGDFAIKPDVTAPGVDIVAARADGAELGPIVDDVYMELSGTSMATPHVAGAAAILAQDEPDWTAEQLKAGLVSSAVVDPDLTVYQQGGGRVDVPATIAADVIATPAPLDLGYFQWPHDDRDSQSAELTYTNTTDEAVTLELSVDVEDQDGRPAEAGMVTVDADQVVVPAGGAETVTVTVDPAFGALGLYSGAIVATDGDTTVRTPAGFYKEPERYDLTVQGITRDGGPADDFDTVAVLEMADGEFGDFVDFADGEATLRVAPGTYAASALLTSGEDFEIDSVSAVTALDVTVASDTTVVLDARTANRITVDTPAHDTEPLDQTLDVSLADDKQMVGFTASFSVGPQTELYAAPTDEPEVGTFGLTTMFALIPVGADPASTPLRYDLAFPETAVPEDLSYTAPLDELATLDTRFTAHAEGVGAEGRAYVGPDAFFVFMLVRELALPGERVDYLSTPPGGGWLQSAALDFPFGGEFTDDIQTYEAGSARDVTWFGQPVAPSLDAYFPVARFGDMLEGFFWPFVDSDGHLGYENFPFEEDDPVTDEIALRVYRDDELVYHEPDTFLLTDLPPGPAELRFELDVARQADWWRLSTLTRTVWETTTQGADEDEEEILPLLGVASDLRLDGLNRLGPGGTGSPRPTLELAIGHQPGADSAPAEEVRVWLSPDDGETWREVSRLEEVEEGRYQATLPPTGQDPSNLRVVAVDADGNRVEQEITRAWAGHPDADGDLLSRLRGPGRIQTAVEVSRERVADDGADAVVLARGDDYPDALAGATLARQLDAPILLTGSEELHPDAAAEIDRVGAGTAVLLGGRAALSEQVADDLDALGLDVDRVDGANRFATAALIAERLDSGVDGAIVAEGGHPDPLRGWPDPLSAAPLAAATGQPILLTSQGDLPPETAAALDALGVDETIVVGGDAAVSDQVVAEIDDRGHAPRRVAGATRYETSRALLAEAEAEAQAAGLDGQWLWLATGWNWPDALAAGPTVAAFGDALVLVDGRDLDGSPPSGELLADRADTLNRLYLLGGTDAISAEVEARIRGIVE